MIKDKELMELIKLIEKNKDKLIKLNVAYSSGVLIGERTKQYIEYVSITISKKTLFNSESITFSFSDGKVEKNGRDIMRYNDNLSLNDLYNTHIGVSCISIKDIFNDLINDLEFKAKSKFL